MRAISIIIIILLIALLLSPLWFGMKAEEEYNKLIDAASKVENLEIENRNYDRGWLKSSAQVTYSIQDGDEEYLKIFEEDTIYHGPIPIGLLSQGKMVLKPVMAIIDTSAKIETQTESEFKEVINSLPPFNVETTISLNGAGKYETSLAPIDATTEDNKTIKWSGLDGLGSFILNPRQASSVFNSSEFMIEDENAIVSIKDINLESDLIYPTPDFKNPLGNMSLRFGELSSEGKSDDDTSKVTFNNLMLNASTNQKAELLNHIHSIGFEEMEVGGNSYGPGIYELEIRNIDKDAFNEIQTAIQNSYSNIEESSDSTEVILAEFMKVLPKLITKSPEIELTKLSIKTGEGEIAGHALISASGNSLDNPEIAANPIFLLAAISAEANLSVSKELLDNLFKDYNIEGIIDVANRHDEELPSDEELQILGKEKAQAEIQEMLDQNILVLKNGNYIIEATYSLGQVTLNGKPLDLGAIMNQL